MRRIIFLGDSRLRIRSFPEDARREVGHELQRVQLGLDPNDWKPLAVVGAGIRELRVRSADGAFRVMYLTRTEDAIYVLHAFQKKTQKTTQKDIALAVERFKQIRSGLGPRARSV
ncbi:MAG: type II toxin-antitoxin system RelE/ParE family toxin [Alphaproteobacteria bacterium]|nr:type II toxin-antitoxin system RelE/ParE family toxin [Alphaproteobacteria bacterium]